MIRANPKACAVFAAHQSFYFEDLIFILIKSTLDCVSDYALLTMRLTRPKKPQAAAVKQLVHAVQQWEDAKTKPEQLFWEQQSTSALDAALASGKDTVLMNALDVLWEEHPEAYERMADLAENSVQSRSHDDGTVSLLFAIPVLTWSRNQLPIGKTDEATIAALKQAVKTHWLADGVSLSLGHTLYGPDDLPDGFVSTAKLSKKHFDDAQQGKDTPYSRKASAYDDDPFLADCRFWLGVLRAKAGAPLFQAQLSASGDLDLQAQEDAWRIEAAVAAHTLFIGCAYEILPPEGYYEACRSSELEIRGFSLQASALMIMTSLELGADQIRAVIAACHSTQFEEYRISLLTKTSSEVLQGVTWPLLGRSETQAQMLEEIQANLKALGIQRIRMIDEQLPMDYCDDCGTPLFPDLNAELVHPGSPDEDEHDAKDRVVH